MKIRKISNKTIKVHTDKKLYYIPEDLINKFIDDNFFRDLADDLCDMDINKFIEPFLKKVETLIFTEDKILKSINKETLLGIYAYNEITYKKPITYKIFKKIIQQTLPLSKLLLLMVELRYAVKTIQESYDLPLTLFANFEPKEFIMYVLTLSLNSVLKIGTKSEFIEYIYGNIEYRKWWKKCPDLLKNYWYWVFIYDSLYACCKTPLLKMAKLSKEYAWEAFKASENNPNIDNDEIEIRKSIENDMSKDSKRIAHNAYTDEEKMIIYEAKRSYKAIINMYRLSKFILKSLSKHLNYISAHDKLENLPLDDESEEFSFALSKIYNCNQQCTNCEYKKGKTCTCINLNEKLAAFKIYTEYRQPIINQVLFNKHRTIKEILTYLENTSKVDFALEIIKENYQFFSEKSNKTISNIFADFEEIKTQEEYYNKFKENFYNTKVKQESEIVVRALKTIAEGWYMYLSNPTDDKRQFLMMNIKQIEMLHSYKKNPKQILE